MSDRETILQTVRLVQHRIRANRILELLALRLALWVSAGLLVRVIDFVRPFGPSVIRVLAVTWLVGLAGLILWSLRLTLNPRQAAAAVDRKANLDDEVLSAWWFIENDQDSAPWITLHVRRTAAHLSRLDIPKIFPRVIPPLSYLTGVGLVLLVGLQFVPLQFPAGQLLSGPRPPLDEFSAAESLMAEIEELLERADQLDSDGSLEQFRSLMDEVRDPGVTLPEVTSELDNLQSTLDEGNLSTAGILEGLEDMAEQLMTAPETTSAGEALSRGDLGGAASELDQLSDSLGSPSTQSDGLADALARAAEDERPGLEALAESLRQAAQNLEEGNTADAGAALSDAAGDLRELSRLVEGQELRNQASDRVDQLRDALESSGQGEPGDPQNGGQQQGQSSQGDQAAASGEPGQPGEGPAEPGQSGEGPSDGVPEGAQPGAGDAAPGGAAAGEDASGQPGSIEAAISGDSGLMPTGLGFSPEQKTGLATSLEVQLELEATEAIAAANEPGQTVAPEEEASRQEQSRIEYRDVPSDLSPAQQELLNQEQIPREYRNLIREYFQAIRPPVTP